ncbi:PREDICTED: zinc finger A20 and AN1 domain-containing stress-associated protein 5-like [Ipomoea nil]|uniref:zinc finger A20 and AN1 domain-containing stress-associated protein 5-like n=1 Tax=Ipomoea nil TaxID=35883 RepID=UPI000901372E|nr:PREDICTED: zinc finger A20 and AN1 domain-containing stress-associated protein 5-like [Ipomoea nil]
MEKSEMAFAGVYCVLFKAFRENFFGGKLQLLPGRYIEAFLNIASCVNNCGVTGNPATNNLCQKCFNAVSTSVSASTATIPHKFSDKSPRSIIRRSSSETTREDWRLVGDDEAKVDSSPVPPRRGVSRCSGCRRKVGLTGF